MSSWLCAAAAVSHACDAHACWRLRMHACTRARVHLPRLACQAPVTLLSGLACLHALAPQCTRRARCSYLRKWYGGKPGDGTPTKDPRPGGSGSGDSLEDGSSGGGGGSDAAYAAGAGSSSGLTGVAVLAAAALGVWWWWCGRSRRRQRLHAVKGPGVVRMHHSHSKPHQ